MNGRARRRGFAACFGVLCASVLALFLIPAARLGAMALCNRLFALSEQSNAYVYDAFPVPADQDTAFAIALLTAAALAWCGLTAAARGPVPALLTALILAGGQMYWGVALPGALNVLLFACLALRMLKNRLAPRSAAALLLLIGAAALLTAVLWPGVDAPTEAASERVRDYLSQAVGAATGGDAREAQGITETRRVNPRSLAEGERAADASSVYRLQTEEEAQISRPRWIDYLKIAALMLLTVAVLVLPFVPFAVLNRRRKKAQEARTTFDGPDIGRAVSAMFRQVAAYLEACGLGGGNLPYLTWAEALDQRLSPAYAGQYRQGALLWQEAAYSAHPLTEEQREQMRALLRETERLLYDEVGWRQRMRLKYRDCLHE